MKSRPDPDRSFDRLYRWNIGVFFLIACWLGQSLLAKETILVLRPDNPHFEDAIEGFRLDLSDDFEILDFFVSKHQSRSMSSQMAKFHQSLEKNHPRLLVLMNNYSIEFFRKYTDKYGPIPHIPVLVMMAVFAEPMIDLLDNATGIHYEVPAITYLVNLRSLMKKPLRKVGVIYRSHLKSFYLNQKELCAREQIELVGIEIQRGSRMLKRVRNALKSLTSDDEIDALWVLNDSFILSDRYRRKAWTPILKNYPNPVVVGIETFVNKTNVMGSFAVVPDHYSLGQQAAELVHQIRDQEWQAGDIPVSYPFGVLKILNITKLDPSIQLNDEALLELDKIIDASKKNTMESQDDP
ncbi:hypothetical protein SCOR_11770 [Sulfidibacter corallicola]|uniref:ABC transporter substrate binding protein n=1 Tax=Sulfidibacter corallicola TaxID=2818388 RepID=A0A8A4TEL3_SULCO|nr:hypothetical protein [Sulfidibacter corallicola]QTD47990.1 hypothetical protein J3U87_20580 [Sulfidibacter corallicola]